MKACTLGGGYCHEQPIWRPFDAHGYVYFLFGRFLCSFISIQHRLATTVVAPLFSFLLSRDLLCS